MALPLCSEQLTNNLKLLLKFEYVGSEHDAGQIDEILRQWISPEARNHVASLTQQDGRHRLLVRFTTLSYRNAYRYSPHSLFTVEPTVTLNDVKAFERATHDSEVDQEFADFLKEPEPVEGDIVAPAIDEGVSDEATIASQTESSTPSTTPSSAPIPLTSPSPTTPSTTPPISPPSTPLFTAAVPSNSTTAGQIRPADVLDDEDIVHPPKRFKFADTRVLASITNLNEQLTTAQQEEARVVNRLLTERSELFSLKRKLYSCLENIDTLIPDHAIRRYARDLLLNGLPDGCQYEWIFDDNGYYEERHTHTESNTFSSILMLDVLNEEQMLEARVMLEAALQELTESADVERVLIERETERVWLLRQPLEDLHQCFQDLVYQSTRRSI